MTTHKPAAEMWALYSDDGEFTSRAVPVGAWPEGVAHVSTSDGILTCARQVPGFLGIDLRPVPLEDIPEDDYILQGALSQSAADLGVI